MDCYLCYQTDNQILNALPYFSVAKNSSTAVNDSDNEIHVLLQKIYARKLTQINDIALGNDTLDPTRNEPKAASDSLKIHQ